jgi:hypothetical protein
MVPEVEVFGSGRAVIDTSDLQEAVVTSKKINEYKRVFITIAFLPLVMKKPGHPPEFRSPGYSERRLLTGLAIAAEID